ncbi:hypothetical protein CVO96_19930 [Deinococcus koreensis]|uniref:Uncharacterized protein n=1 Tax=Deinococcus koreensis TaxID=2054903 RepID=A0A2K3US68_9DEIO|nr:hypothetical protein CVO96_19930 [Deinococcus koreensis]
MKSTSLKLTAQQQAHAHANSAQVKGLTEHLYQVGAIPLDDSAAPVHAEGPSESGGSENPGFRPSGSVADVLRPSSRDTFQLAED